MKGSIVALPAYSFSLFIWIDSCSEQSQTIIINWAGMILITPPYAHVSVLLLLISGPILETTVGFSGIHVPTGTGRHGPGVSTPKAADVSAAVTGFNMLMQTPNGTMFKNGTQLIVVPIGPLLLITIDGRKVSGVGAAPKGH